ncbi:MAG: NUDIX domain-containing protein [Patescibacteria group bacterium]|jgi:8-oxo-dGTP pyrophosphatase MutT (NUDIX family)
MREGQLDPSEQANNIEGSPEGAAEQKESERIIKTAGVLVFKDNKVLLVCHGKKAGHIDGTYGIPAGRLEDGELSIETAVRELLEESGLETTVEDLEKIPGTYTASIKRKGGTRNFSLETFRCKNWSGELCASDETVPEWVDIDSLDKLDLLPNVKRMISDAMTLK